MLFTKMSSQNNYGRFFYMKIKKIFAVVLLLALLIAGLCACRDEIPDNSNGVEITLTVCGKDKSILFEKTVKTDKSFLSDVLKETEGLSFVFSTGDYGEYIESVDVIGKAKLEPASNEFISVFHNLDDPAYGEKGSPYNVTINGTEYISSFAGVSSMPVFDGAGYLLMLV